MNLLIEIVDFDHVILVVAADKEILVLYPYPVVAHH